MVPWILVVVSSIALVLSSALPAATLDVNLGVGAGASASRGGGGSAGVSAGFDAYASSSTDAEPGSAAFSATSAAAILASADAESRIETVIRLIETSDWNEMSFASLSSLSGSAAFNVDEWLTLGTEADFNTSLEANWSEVQELHAAIDANGAFSAWLESGGIQSENVVAVGQTANGSLAVFTSGS